VFIARKILISYRSNVVSICRSLDTDGDAFPVARWRGFHLLTIITEFLVLIEVIRMHTIRPWHIHRFGFIDINTVEAYSNESQYAARHMTGNFLTGPKFLVTG
jgi:hypothetical protein